MVPEEVYLPAQYHYFVIGSGGPKDKKVLFFLRQFNVGILTTPDKTDYVSVATKVVLKYNVPDLYMDWPRITRARESVHRR